MKNNLFRFAILLVTLILTQTAFADVKIKARQTMSGQSSESTTYIKGKRMRSEQNTGGMETVNITQCDLKRSLRLMPQAQTYMIDAWLPAQNVAPTTTKTQTQAVTKGGVVTTTVTTKDTGERKQMFGYTAKHLIMTMESASSPDACNANRTKMEIDGWYIDAAFVLNCENDQMIYRYVPPTKGGCQDRYEMKQVGKAKTGYPVLEKTTMFDENGKESFTMTSEVVELSNATLDAAMFDVPEGYREVKDQTELYASMAKSNSTYNNPKTNSNPKINQSSSADLNNAPTSAAMSAIKSSSDPGEKKDGVVRIGLAQIKTGAVGEGINALELAAAIKNTLGEYLDSPKVEVFQLEAKLPSAIEAEAKSIDCDYVIYANVSYKKGGGGFGMFKKIAPAFGSVVPVAGMGGSVGGAVAGQVASTLVYTAAGMAANVKSKDEMTLDVKLQSAAGGTAFAKQFKAKAKSDGDDIISPIVEQAAQWILDAAAKK